MREIGSVFSIEMLRLPVTFLSVSTPNVTHAVRSYPYELAGCYHNPFLHAYRLPGGVLRKKKTYTISDTHPSLNCFACV